MLDVFESLPKGYFVHQEDYSVYQEGYSQKVLVVQLVLELRYRHSQYLSLKRMLVHVSTLDKLPQLQEFVLLIVTGVQVVFDYLNHHYLSSQFTNSLINYL